MKAVCCAFYALCLVGLCSCHSEGENAADGSKINQYVYVGAVSTIHVDENCPNLTCHTSKLYIDTLEFGRGYDTYSYCTYCINEETYKHLQRIKERNRTR